MTWHYLLNTPISKKRSNFTQLQQLLSEIMNLEQNPTNSNSRQELDSKKQQLKVLETKAKELIKPLPLDTQITILQKEIKVLTNKSTKTKAEEVLLVDKRKQLNELLGGKNNSFTTNAKSGDKTTLYIGCGVIGTLLVIVIFIVSKKKKY